MGVEESFLGKLSIEKLGQCFEKKNALFINLFFIFYQIFLK